MLGWPGSQQARNFLASLHKTFFNSKAHSHHRFSIPTTDNSSRPRYKTMSIPLSLRLPFHCAQIELSLQHSHISLPRPPPPPPPTFPFILCMSPFLALLPPSSHLLSVFFCRNRKDGNRKTEATDAMATGGSNVLDDEESVLEGPQGRR